MQSPLELPPSTQIALSSTDVRILTVLAELKMIGNDNPLRSLVMARSKFKSIGSLNNLLPNLEREGLVVRRCSKTVAITAAGLQRPEIKVVKPPANNMEHHNNIKGLLNQKQADIFDVLVDGKIHNRNEVASGLGCYTSHKGHFQNTLSGMKTLGIISYPSSAEVQLTDICFTERKGVAKSRTSSTSHSYRSPSRKPSVAKKAPHAKHVVEAHVCFPSGKNVGLDHRTPAAFFDADTAAYDADTDVESRPATAANNTGSRCPRGEPDDVYDYDTDMESKPAAANHTGSSGASSVATCTIDLTSSDDESSPESTPATADNDSSSSNAAASSAIDLTYSDDESIGADESASWDPNAVADAEAAKLADHPGVIAYV